MPVRTELRLWGPNGPALDPATWDPGGIRGADKVAARFAYALLTPQGSVPGRPNDGSPFTELAAGFRSDFDVFAAFAAAESAVTATVRAAEQADEPKSEKLGSAVLTAVTLSGDSVTLTLSVTAADGSTPGEPVDIVTNL